MKKSVTPFNSKGGVYWLSWLISMEVEAGGREEKVWRDGGQLRVTYVFILTFETDLGS